MLFMTWGMGMRMVVMFHECMCVVVIFVRIFMFVEEDGREMEVKRKEGE